MHHQLPPRASPLEEARRLRQRPETRDGSNDGNLPGRTSSIAGNVVADAWARVTDGHWSLKPGRAARAGGRLTRRRQQPLVDFPVQCARAAPALKCADDGNKWSSTAGGAPVDCVIATLEHRHTGSTTAAAKQQLEDKATGKVSGEEERTKRVTLKKRHLRPGGGGRWRLVHRSPLAF